MKYYWDRHLLYDAAFSVCMAALFWFVPKLGFLPILLVKGSEFGDLCSRWLAGNLTLIGLITATTGFLSTAIEKPEFMPLVRSTSSAQLWEILRESLLWLYVSALFCFVGAFVNFGSMVFQYFLFVGTFLGFIVSISIWKLVWVMRSVLKVKITVSRNGIKG